MRLQHTTKNRRDAHHGHHRKHQHHHLERHITPAVLVILRKEDDQRQQHQLDHECQHPRDQRQQSKRQPCQFPGNLRLISAKLRVLRKKGRGKGPFAKEPPEEVRKRVRGTKRRCQHPIAEHPHHDDVPDQARHSRKESESGDNPYSRGDRARRLL